MGRNQSDQVMLEYPEHVFRPVEAADFIRMEGFTAEWEKFGLTEEHLKALKVGIMAMPTGHPVIKGTRGLRRLCFHPKGWEGKRGTLRVAYAYFKRYRLILLLVVYAKKEIDNLSKNGRRDVKEYLKRIRMELSKGPIK